jgi:hypothetical protein
MPKVAVLAADYRQHLADVATKLSNLDAHDAVQHDLCHGVPTLADLLACDV